jgi:crossover junction endodeoxyribonuclease RuvC
MASCIPTRANWASVCCACIAGLCAVIIAHAPTAAAVEQTFVNKDAVGTLKLGQARGIALLAPAEAGLEIGEYAPNAVKKAVVGVGHAGKEQVQHMVRHQLPGVNLPAPTRPTRWPSPSATPITCNRALRIKRIKVRA